MEELGEINEKKFLPFEYSIGPKDATLAFVGDFWRRHEEWFKSPLVGFSGVELARMLSEVQLTKLFTFPKNTAMEPYMISHWLSTGHFFTNTFAERPPDNKLEENWCLSKPQLPEGYDTPYYKPGKYIKPEFLPHIPRMVEEIKTLKPNLVVALGDVPCWALLGSSGITALRGTVAWSTVVDCKVLPTFHPAHVLRQWNMRTVVLQDLLKAKREMLFPEIRRPQRWVLVSPTFEDIRAWMQRPATHYAVDIETRNGQITMVGFARARDDALVIPFITPTGGNYWQTHEEEVRAWACVKELLEGEQVKIFQNGLFDLSYLARMGFRPRNCLEDTMLLHHSLYPELRKGLGFLGSIYTDESSWKLLRHRAKDEQNKREE